MANTIIGKKPQLAWVNVAEINSDHNYQRELRPRRVKQILAEFDWAKFQPVSLNRQEDGSLWVYDGQHRVEAARQHSKITQIPAAIVAMKGGRDEATAFIGVNVNRMAVTPVERYWAGLEAGDAAMMEICALLEECGCDVVAFQGDKKPEKTNSVTALARAIKHSGFGCTKSAVMILRNAWPHDTNCLSGIMITSIASLVWVNQETIDEDRLVSVLAELSRKTIAGDAEVLRKISGGSASINIKKVLVAKYNKGLGAGEIKIVEVA